MNRVSCSILFLLVPVIVGSAQDTPIRYDFSGATAEENKVSLMGAGFGQYPQADVTFGAIPTDNAFEDATDGRGMIVQAEPGEGVMILTPSIQTPHCALIRCSVRISSPAVSIYLASIDQSESVYISTLTPTNPSSFIGRYRRIADFFLPPSSGFQGIIQILNTGSTETVTVYLDNLEILILDKDNIDLAVTEITGKESAPVATPTPVPPTLTPTPTVTPTATPGALPVIDGLKVANVSWNYSSPYLLDFNFSLRDADDHAVIIDPSLLKVVCKEDSDPISSSETAFIMAGADKKQLKCYLVLDYTGSMADPINGDDNNDGISNAIETMQSSAIQFINTLNEQSQVGIYEFHSENDPQQVVSFTNNKTLLQEKIAKIWEDQVQWFPGTSRCWDAVYAAIGQFDSTKQRDEQRFVIFLSDGRDESSSKKPSDIISLANQKDVKIYCIGFGAELDAATLQNITSQTNGEYYTASSVQAMTENFQQIIYDLGGQYLLRWATLKRSSTSFKPSFTITYGNYSDTFSNTNSYSPTSYSGDPLKGALRFVVDPQLTNRKAVAYIRAEYTPRYIRRIRFLMKNQHTYTVSLVSKSNGGLCADWTVLPLEDDAESGGKWIEIQSPNPNNIYSSIPYGAFGALIRIDFDNVTDLKTLFGDKEGMSVDNTIYAKTGGQSFQLTNVSWVGSGTSGGDTYTVNLGLSADAKPLEMVLIPAGTFMMGSPGSEQNRDDDEGPQHEVTISQPFYLGKYEVTQAQWKAVMNSTPSSFGWNPNYPVEQVSWDDCQTFIQKLNQLGQGTFRLPTEAEWEYACRAGSTTAFYWGEDSNYSQIGQYAWYSSNSGSKTHEVGTKLPNTFGLFDMSGNVWEWCQDWYGSYGSGTQIDPTGVNTGSYRVLRGGSWGNNARGCRSADRLRSDPGSRSGLIGFRICRTQ